MHTMLTIETEALPIHVWARPEDLEGQDGAIEQARNLANHPRAVLRVGLMPDFHQGYGMPIGGVFATRESVVPNAVGVDIGCGMMAVETDLEVARFSREDLEKIRQGVHLRVPVGNGPQGQHRHPNPKASRLPQYGEDMEVVFKRFEHASYQLGTLGGGNHFIEFQTDEYGALWVMIHSGSRALGKAICDHYDALTIKQGPRDNLGYLDIHDTAFGRYISEMSFAMDWAEENRTCMFDAVIETFGSDLGINLVGAIQQEVRTHHNYANSETHDGQVVMVHRKGAVKAEGLVTIPGSMGTASYIAGGLMNPLAFNTCSHGAGRVMGRKQANREITKEQAVAAMGQVVYGIRDGDFDEMPMAYKDVDQVMANQSDLVTPLYRLRPLAVVKG